MMKMVLVQLTLSQLTSNYIFLSNLKVISYKEAGYCQPLFFGEILNA